ncbi:cytoskeleton-associated protein 2 [Willisornis vidua]|uniref:Cytoskeleton-associated protein 2 n=1 Tax=Willisornis vidua TaxID=1566151 RepID=A0ABQ9DAJ1_9PASS|nr:cytoskeleton-associated protein 2 [Willisornis vidua]
MFHEEWLRELGLFSLDFHSFKRLRGNHITLYNYLEVVASSRTRRATSKKLQDNLQLSTSPKPEMENKENDDKLSWDQSSVSSEKNVALNSSTIPLTSYVPEANWNLDGEASKAKDTEIKSQHVSFSKAFLEIKRIREKQMIAENQNASVTLPKKPALGKYRGRVIQSKINSFRKAVKTEGEKEQGPDKKLLPSATTQAANSSSTKSCSAVLKTIKVTNNTKSLKTNGVLPLLSKPPEKVAVHSQSGLKKQQLAVAAAPNKVTVQKLVGGRGPQPPKAASSNPDHRVQGVKKCADFCKGARPEAPAKPISVVPGTKPGQNSKTNGNRKSVLPKETAEERRARLDQWRASRGKVMRRPPIYALLGSQSKSEEQEFSADALEQSEKVNKTLSECLQLTEQGCHGNDVRAMLEDLMQSIPGVKRLAKFWICSMRLEQMGPLEKLLTVYEEAILAGARPKEELRHTLIDTMKNNESLLKSENGASVIEAHVSELVEVSKEANSSVEPVQETFKDFCSDDVQNAESDKKAEASSEAIKKEETDLDLKPREEILPKKNKKRKAREHKKKKGKCETEQNEDGIKDTAQAFNSPEKGNDTSCSLRYNPPTTPYLERKDDFSLKTPLRYSQRLRERMCKLTDTAKEQDPCVSSLEQLGELESKATVFIHEQSNAFQETSAEIEV